MFSPIISCPVFTPTKAGPALEIHGQCLVFTPVIAKNGG